jgi:hypothetical protein
MPGIEIPRLTETLAPLAWPRRCQACGAELSRPVPRLGPAAGKARAGSRSPATVWQEHDDADRPELRYIVLCGACADRLIEPHPRLYRRLGRNEPAPGVMQICEGCRHRQGGRCVSPRARAHGGPGLAWPAADVQVHIQRAGPGGRGRSGEWIREWHEEPETCEGREPAEGPST